VPHQSPTGVVAVAVSPQRRAASQEMDVTRQRIYEVDAPMHDTNHPDRHGCE
jgi:hypothetical protein